MTDHVVGRRAARSGRGPVAAGGDRRGAHRDYVRRRARQIAYGRWEPWADAGPAREHVRVLRASGTSYQAIGEAAGVGAMTVHHLLNGCQAAGQPAPDRISASCSRRLLAVTRAGEGGCRRDACGSRRRLRALVALGHSPASLARLAGMSQQRMRRLLRGQVQSVSAADFAGVCCLYSRLWNRLPSERTPREQATAEAARRRAETAGWPPPMALDDDRIDDPAYRPRIAWRRAAGPS